MSMHALLDAVEAALRADLGYDEDTCRVMADGEPPAICPTYPAAFAAVSDGEWRPADAEADGAQDEYFGVVVTLSTRVAWLTKDRQGKAVRDASAGLYARAEAIRALLRMNYDLLAVLNAALGHVEWVEPLRFLGAEKVRRVGASYFGGHTKGGKDDWSASDDAGLVLAMRFGQSRRIVRLDTPPT